MVNRVSKKADGIRTRNIEFSTGSYGRKRVTMDVGDKLHDELAYRVNVIYEQSYGYWNLYELERWGIKPTLTWKQTDKRSSSYDVKSQQQEWKRFRCASDPWMIVRGLYGSFCNLDGQIDAALHLICLWKSFLNASIGGF